MGWGQLGSTQQLYSLDPQGEGCVVVASKHKGPMLIRQMMDDRQSLGKAVNLQAQFWHSSP